MKRKEIAWLFGTILVVFILNLLIYGVDVFKSDSRIDLNVHDVYFVISHWYFMFFQGILLLFGVYLVRALRGNFMNLAVNLILMISIIVLIMTLSELNSAFEILGQQNTGWTINPSIDSSDEVLKNTKQNGADNYDVNEISTVLFYLQFALLIFLTYCGFKTGLNFNKDSHE